MPRVALSQAGLERRGILVGKAVVVQSFVWGAVEGGAQCSAMHSQIGSGLNCGCRACIYHVFTKT